MQTGDIGQLRQDAVEKIIFHATPKKWLRGRERAIGCGRLRLLSHGRVGGQKSICRAWSDFCPPTGVQWSTPAQARLSVASAWRECHPRPRS
jgi:hypothetical protein